MLPVPVLPARDAVVFPGLIHTLHVAREGSRRAVRSALAESRPVFVVSQRDMSVEDPSSAELNRIGTLCEPLQAVPLPDGSLRVALRGLHRAEAVRYSRRAGVIYASLEDLPDQESTSDETEALMRASIELFTEIIEKGKKIPIEAFDIVSHQETSGALADSLAHHLPLRPAQKQEVLEQLEGPSRLAVVFGFLRREQRLLSVQSEIAERIDRDLASAQREFFLREQLQAIQKELDGLGEAPSEIRALREQIEAAHLTPEASERAIHELSRLERMPPNSPEGMVIRGYLDWLMALPWTKLSPDLLDIAHAKAVLDEAHFGLQTVKERVLDFLAVRQLSQKLRGPILCFVGPPGVGKTSVGRSIADALGREFVRISLGGIRDEAEIRGHRRTYVGAMPGRILQSLRQCGSRNPVMVLDEIDKMASDYRGDPSSALLEALDPAQNERYSDHYLETPFNLSDVLFIATANSVYDIPYALRDRMEIVSFPSYTDAERRQIAERFVLPRQCEEHGLLPGQVKISRAALETLVREYTREAGVRNLERTIGAVCRKVARRIAEGKAKSARVGRRDLEGLLGPAIFGEFGCLSPGEVGVATGLVVTEFGGETIPIEVLLTEPNRNGPVLRLTGNLGMVMQESAEAALSCVKSLRALGVSSEEFDRDLHIHVPDNAMPKEGPSAGLTIAVALASALTKQSIRPQIAFSGEISLRGKVMPVGGVREKLVAAHRAGVKVVVLSRGNRQDLHDVPRDVLAGLQVKLVDRIEEALELALQPLAASAVVKS